MILVPFVSHGSARRLEEWAKLETKALLNILCTYGIMVILVGTMRNQVVAANFIGQMRQHQEELDEYVVKIGKKRKELTEQLFAGLSQLDRETVNPRQQRQGEPNVETLELTGTPQLLTCALALHACKASLESSAFALMVRSSLEPEMDTKMASMLQLSQRLEDMDTNPYGYASDSEVETADKRKNQGSWQGASATQCSAEGIRDMVAKMKQWKQMTSIYRLPPPEASQKEAAQGQGNEETKQAKSRFQGMENAGLSNFPSAYSTPDGAATLPTYTQNTAITNPKEGWSTNAYDQPRINDPTLDAESKRGKDRLALASGTAGPVQVVGNANSLTDCVDGWADYGFEGLVDGADVGGLYDLRFPLDLDFLLQS